MADDDAPVGGGLIRMRATARAAARAARAARTSGSLQVDDIADAVLAAVLSGADPFVVVQAAHDHRLTAEPGHDQVGCWCCCLTCAVGYHMTKDDE